MRRSSFLLVIVAIAMMLAVITPASAAVYEEFFAGGAGSAGWVTFTPAPPSATDTDSIELSVPDGVSYAGVDFTGVPTAAPSTPPSYAFRSNLTNAGSGGSPRLRIKFSDSGSMDLRPLDWTADTWVTIDGSGVLWDNNGGTCGFLYATTYATGVGCHAGATVTSFHVVSDSGWLASPYKHYIDDIKYGDLTVSARDCKRSSAGDLENGPVSAPVHEVVEPAVGGVDSGLGETVHGINCDVIVELGL